MKAQSRETLRSGCFKTTDALFRKNFVKVPNFDKA